MPTNVQTKKLVDLLEASDVLGFKTLFKSLLNEDIDDELPAAIDAVPLGSLTDVPDVTPGQGPADTVDSPATSVATTSDDQTNLPDGSVQKLDEDDDVADVVSDEAVETDALSAIRKSAVTCGGDEGYYEDGVLDLSIPTLDAAKQFSAFLDACDSVDSYEIEGLSFDDAGDILPGEDQDLNAVTADQFVAFEFYIYLNPDLVVDEPVVLDAGDVIDDENGTLEEMKRVIRVTMGSPKKSKIRCKAGFRFDHGQKRCAKLDEEAQIKVHKAAKIRRVAAKSMSGASHKQISKKAFKNTRARKRFGSGR